MPKSKPFFPQCLTLDQEMKERVMSKSWLLYSGVELNLEDRVLGEVEKNSFIALPAKENTTGSCP